MDGLFYYWSGKLGDNLGEIQNPMNCAYCNKPMLNPVNSSQKVHIECRKAHAAKIARDGYHTRKWARFQKQQELQIPDPYWSEVLAL